jgi:hypothetical protein
MLDLNIILDGDGAWPDLAEKEVIALDPHALGQIQVAALIDGLASGRPAVAIRVDLPDGKVRNFNE